VTVPYRVVGQKVYVMKAGKWRLLKKHPTRAKALAHFRALKINVRK
jgi:hypothetical protein